MAIRLADVVTHFTADQSKLDAAMGESKGKLTSFAGGATKLIGGALVGAAGAAAGAIIGVGVAAFDVSRQTEQATADIAASLGIPTDAAREFGEVARQVYGNNFADSVTDAGVAVAELAKQLGLTASDPALKTMTENAFRLRDAFGVEVNESVDAVKTLMENFGVSSEEAFDLLAAGYQRGLDRSGDFLDTIGEYSVQFAAGGANASQFFSLLESGLQGGMLGTDKAADAFKEFRVRILDGSDATASAFDMLEGRISFNLKDIEDGTVSVADAFTEITAALGELEDPADRMQAGVGLLGTQFEDLGDQAIAALDLTRDWSAGSITEIASLDAKYATFGSAVSGVWRRLTVSVSPFTDKLLELVNNAMPAVMGAFDAFDRRVGPIMQGAQRTIDSVVGFVKNLFSRDLADSIDGATGRFDFIGKRIGEIMPYIQQIVTTVLGAVQSFWQQWGGTITSLVQNNLQVILTAFTTVLDVVLQTVKLFLQILTGDWQGAGETLKSIAQTIWDGISEIFRLQLENLRTLVGGIDLAAAGRAILDGLKQGMIDKWHEVESWFYDKLQRLRNMLPFSEPKDPTSPLRGLSKAGSAAMEEIQKGIERSALGLGKLNVPALMGGAAQTATNGPITITVHVNGENGGMGDSVRLGVLDALRQAGLR